jgi:hypothetical protein
MSIKSKVFAGAAALSVMAGGLGVAGAMTAQAATPSCGSRCVSIYTEGWGAGNILDVYKRVDKVGQKVILWAPSNYDPAEDFTAAFEGSVHSFYEAGLASAALNLHYGKDPAFELEYAPYGVESGLCVGVAKTAANGEAVTLQQCGASSKSVWVVDRAQGTKNGVPLINGSDTNFADPYVLTNRAGVLYTQQLSGFSNGTINDNQIWAGEAGVQL